MELKLPKLGEGADSGIVVNVFVKEGDQIAQDQAVKGSVLTFDTGCPPP